MLILYRVILILHCHIVVIPCSGLGWDYENWFIKRGFD